MAKKVFFWMFDEGVSGRSEINCFSQLCTLRVCKWDVFYILRCSECARPRAPKIFEVEFVTKHKNGGVRVCLCLCARSACTPPLLAGVCGVGVCVWAPVSVAPRHSWLGCWGCVFVCALRLYPATPRWCVRFGCVCFVSGFSCAPPLVAWVLGCVCACARAPLVPRHSWLGCAVCVCVCAWARVLAAPRHSWLGCWGVCVFVCPLRFYPTIPGWGVRCVCVCSGSGFSCAPPLLAWVLGFVCACVPAPLVPSHSWLGLRCVCVCLGPAFGCAPPLLAGVLGGVCVCVPAPHVPRHSWLVCAVWVCVLGLGFRLRPASPGSGSGCVCVCVCVPRLYPATPGWGVVLGVCAWALVLAAPCISWRGVEVCVFVCALRLYPATRCRGVRCGCVCLGSGFGCAPPLLAGPLGSVCVRVPAPLVPRHSWLGCAVWVCVLGLGFRLRPTTPGWGVGVCVFVCALRLYPATPGWGLWCVGWVLPGTCSCAVVRSGSCALPGLAAPGGRFCMAPVRVPGLWPAACLSDVPLGPALVCRASSDPVALGAPVGFPYAVVPFPIPGGCAPGFTGRLREARGGRPRTRLFVPAAGPCRGRGAGLALRRTRSGPRNGVVPGGSLRRRSWAPCAAVVCVCGPGH